MFLIIREQEFESMESSFRIVGQYQTKEVAEEKRSAFRVIDDKGDVNLKKEKIKKVIKGLRKGS